MKITEINVENISSVNFVKYSTKLDVEKNAERYNNKLDHKPVHA